MQNVDHCHLFFGRLLLLLELPGSLLILLAVTMTMLGMVPISKKVWMTASRACMEMKKVTKTQRSIPNSIPSFGIHYLDPSNQGIAHALSVPD
jgi:hypothetical protein